MATSDVNRFTNPAAILSPVVGERNRQAVKGELASRIAAPATADRRPHGTIETKIPASAFGPGYAASLTGGNIPPELLGGAADNSQKIARAMEEAGGASLFFGGNMTRARQEAIILARELATGVPTTRTLSSLMGSLGYAIGGVALIGFGLYKGFQESSKEVDNLISQSQSLGDELATAAKKWQEGAKAALTPDDLRKIASEAVPELDKIHAKAQAIQQEELGWFSKTIDAITAGFAKFSPAYAQTLGGTARAYKDAADQAKQNAADQARFADEEAARDIQRAQRREKEIELRKSEPALVDELEKNIERLQKQQDALDKSAEDYAQRWLEIAKNIKTAEEELKKVKAAQEKAQKEADQTAKGLEKAIGQTSEDYAESQNKAAREHQAHRMALQQEYQEAVATGDDEHANAIKKELDHDTFARDQRKEELQRYSALQESMGVDPGNAESARAHMGAAAYKYINAQRELEDIYSEERQESGRKIPHPGREAGIGESQDDVDQIERNRKAYEESLKPPASPQAQPAFQPPPQAQSGKSSNADDASAKFTAAAEKLHAAAEKLAQAAEKQSGENSPSTQLLSVMRQLLQAWS